MSIIIFRCLLRDENTNLAIRLYMVLPSIKLHKTNKIEKKIDIYWDISVGISEWILIRIKCTKNKIQRLIFYKINWE